MRVFYDCCVFVTYRKRGYHFAERRKRDAIRHVRRILRSKKRMGAKRMAEIRAIPYGEIPVDRITKFPLVYTDSTHRKGRDGKIK